MLRQFFFLGTALMVNLFNPVHATTKSEVYFSDSYRSIEEKTDTVTNFYYEVYAENAIHCQSATNFGQYLFLVSDKFRSITMYNLKSKSRINAWYQNPYKEEIEGQIVYHCNQCYFGKEKYSDEDVFPLLYINQRSASKNSGAFINVVRIIPEMRTDGEYSSFTAEIVQTIYLPVMTDENCMGNPNSVIDVENGFMYTYSRNNNAEADNYNKARISKFKMPSLRDPNGHICNVVIFKDEDILDAFYCDFSMLYAQGGFYKEGKIYISQGFMSKDKKSHIYLRVVDLDEKRQTFVVDMQAAGFNREPEGCWFYDNSIMIAVSEGGIYQLWIRDLFPPTSTLY